MAGKDKRPGNDAKLRRRAGDMAREKAAQTPKHLEVLSPEETRLMLHELHVHQIELEMQNDELRQAQVELDTARANYFDLYELAPVGFCTISKQGLVLQANLTAATLLGVARGALVKQLFTRFIFKEDQDIHYRFHKRLFESGEPQSCELQMVRNGGTHFWAHLAATIAQDGGGAPVLRIVMCDVTERKQAEQALQESEECYRTLVEGTPEAIEVHRGEKIIYVNPAAIKMFGARSAQDLIGKFHLDLVHPDFHEIVLARVKSIDGQGVSTPMAELKFLKLDGTAIDVEAQSTSIVYNGAPAIHVVARDITARKRAEEIAAG